MTLSSEISSVTSFSAESQDDKTDKDDDGDEATELLLHKAHVHLLQYDWGTITKYIEIHRADFTYLSSPNSVKAFLKELRRFLVLKAVAEDTRATKLSPSGLIDKGWHALLMCPRDYSALCNAILPATCIDRIIDHNPLGALDSHAQQQRYVLISSHVHLCVSQVVFHVE